jgi:phosphate/sulfate permease
MFGLETTLFLLLFLALLAAFAFEFVNGFHDTANAVATVIYTNSLQPQQAVIWSGFMNFLGVVTGGVGVAMGIVNLLPLDLLVDQNVYHSLAMVFAMLLSAIAWNLGTWYFGIPCSSSHTLIGSIIGVGLGYMFVSGDAKAVNWDKAMDIFQALFFSPILGFFMAVFLMFLLKKVIKVDGIFKEPKKDQVPPTWIRGILILTCTLVSFFHGKNDGQKGIGLVMLILIAVVPVQFAIDTDKDPFAIRKDLPEIANTISKIDTTVLSVTEKETYHKVQKGIHSLTAIVADSVKQVPDEQKVKMRKAILSVSKNTDKLLKLEHVNLSKADADLLKSKIGSANKLIDYAPTWVVLMISLALGLGTMIGWKRIVVTIGEKIGKQHLTYAQGASAEIVASITIGLATAYKLPVSTTHVLSSGIAGTMVASKGIKNLQGKTIKNIALAWVLTLPVTMLLSASLFVFFRWIAG